MFGPGLPIHVRERILRRRLLSGGLVSACILAVMFVTIRWTPGPRPPQAGLRGPLVLLPDIDEFSDVEAEHPADAGGHPLPSALTAVDFEIEVETPVRAPDLPQPAEVDEARREVPPAEEEVVKPGPTVGKSKQVETVRPRTATSDDIVILKFVRPTYPPDALLLNNEGSVKLEFLVDLSGNVTEVTSHPDDGLMTSCVEAAERAIVQWRFKPLNNSGVIETFWVEHTFIFRLGRVTASDPQRF
jgi:TonB family protein